MSTLINKGFDAISIMETRERTGLLLHSLYVGGNALILHRLDHIHIVVTMPQVAFNAVYGDDTINDSERTSLLSVIGDMIEEGNYEFGMAGCDDDRVTMTIVQMIMHKYDLKSVRVKYDKLDITIHYGERSICFKKSSLFVRDTFARQHILDALDRNDAVLP